MSQSHDFIDRRSSLKKQLDDQVAGWAGALLHKVPEDLREFASCLGFWDKDATKSFLQNVEKTYSTVTAQIDNNPDSAFVSSLREAPGIFVRNWKFYPEEIEGAMLLNPLIR